jgi:lipopolysaccharide export LptBFGC system permease protein LptF
VSVWLSFSAGPSGNRIFEASVDQAVRKRVTSALRSGTFSESFLDMVLFVDRVDPATQQLQRVFVFDEKSFDEQVAISAKSGRWIQNEDSGEAILSLSDGVLVAEDATGKVVRRMDFEEYRIRANFVTPLGGGRASPASLSAAQLWERRLANAKRRLEGKRVEQRPVWIEFSRRFAVSFACLLFVPLAWLLSVDNRRTARSRSVFMGLLVLMSYWTLYFSVVTWALKTKLPFVRHNEVLIWTLVWVPNLILLAASVGIWMTRTRHRWFLQRKTV